jgi:hypothetical protein
VDGSPTPCHFFDRFGMNSAGRFRKLEIASRRLLEHLFFSGAATDAESSARPHRPAKKQSQII